VIVPIDPNVPPGKCGLDAPAFCETFDAPHPGGKGGDIDETRWAFSRYGHPGGESMFRFYPRSTPTNLVIPDLVFPATFCGQPFSNLLPPNDVKVCAGVGVDGTVSNQLNEVMNDDGDFSYTSMRILQPFDFTNRTGRLVMDVDAKINPMNVGHGWWMEVWITEDPAPMPYHGAPTVVAYPRAGIGFAFQFGGNCPNSLTNWNSMLEGVTVTQNYEILHSNKPVDFIEGPKGPCFKVADAKLNHMEFRINKDTVELWVSDYQNPASFRLTATVKGLDLPFTKGYVHLQHAAYNATKDWPVTDAQTFRWDNIGFDGPTYPLQRLYQAPDNTTRDGEVLQTSYVLSDGSTKKVTIPGVNITGALKASLNFNSIAAADQVIEYRVNSKVWQNYVVRAPREAIHRESGVRAHSVDLNLMDLVNGANDVEFRLKSAPIWEEMVGNIEITVDAQ
jgi:hypothetical protein